MFLDLVLTSCSNKLQEIPIYIGEVVITLNGKRTLSCQFQRLRWNRTNHAINVHGPLLPDIRVNDGVHECMCSCGDPRQTTLYEFSKKADLIDCSVPLCDLLGATFSPFCICWFSHGDCTIDRYWLVEGHSAGTV